jgi:hypothetical protein
MHVHTTMWNPSSGIQYGGCEFRNEKLIVQRQQNMHDVVVLKSSLLLFTDYS